MQFWPYWKYFTLIVVVFFWLNIASDKYLIYIINCGASKHLAFLQLNWENIYFRRWTPNRMHFSIPYKTDKFYIDALFKLNTNNYNVKLLYSYKKLIFFRFFIFVQSATWFSFCEFRIGHGKTSRIGTSY